MPTPNPQPTIPPMPFPTIQPTPEVTAVKAWAGYDHGSTAARGHPSVDFWSIVPLAVFLALILGGLSMLIIGIISVVKGSRKQ